MLLNPLQHAGQPSTMGNYEDCVNMLTLRSLVVGWGGGPFLLFLLTFALTPGLSKEQGYINPTPYSQCINMGLGKNSGQQKYAEGGSKPRTQPRMKQA